MEGWEGAGRGTLLKVRRQIQVSKAPMWRRKSGGEEGSKIQENWRGGGRRGGRGRTPGGCWLDKFWEGPTSEKLCEKCISRTERI